MMESPAVNRWPWVALVTAVLIAFFWLLHPILLPFLLGALIAYLGDPLVDRLEARGHRRTTGVIAVFCAFSLLLSSLMLVAIPLLIDQVDQVIKNIPVFYRWLSESALPAIQSTLSVSGAELPEIDWEAELTARWESLGVWLAQSALGLSRSGLNLLSALINIALVPVVAFYLLRDWDIMMERLLNLVPRAWQQSVSLMVGEADDVLGAFLRGQFLVMLAQATIYSAGLWVIGLDFALVLGTTAGLASIIPYVGAAVGVGSSLGVAWIQTGDVMFLGLVALVFAVGQLLESFVLTPTLIGDRIGLHPVAVIFVLMGGAQLAGFVGVLSALPVAAVLWVFCRHGLQHYRHSDTYQGD
ncbi:MAG: AI-2E family transporter [Halieaceae bacterium]|jgi:predicted PurR-regulated permease PerM